MNDDQHSGGKHNRKNKTIYYSLLRCLLRFITDITNFYYGNYGVFTREFVTLKILSRIRPKNPTFGGKSAKNWDILLWKLQNLTDITEYCRYYGILRILRNITDITEFFLLRNITENYSP